MSSSSVSLPAVEQHVVIGVDEAHSDSLEAIQGGLTFVTNGNPNSRASLFSVVSKGAPATASDDLKKRLEKMYKDMTDDFTRHNALASPIAYHTVSPFGSDTVAQSIVKEGGHEKATLIAIGAGKTSSGALGSVANEIVLRSTTAHVLICKRVGVSTAAKFQQNKPRCFLIAVDGSIASHFGLKELIVNLCKRGDYIRAVTVSDNSKDISIVEAEVAEYKDLIAARGVEVSSSHVPRHNKTAAEVLCELAAEGAVDESHPINALVLGSSNGSSSELGSCTKWCVAKCPISVLVMKVSVSQ